MRAKHLEVQKLDLQVHAAINRIAEITSKNSNSVFSSDLLRLVEDILFPRTETGNGFVSEAEIEAWRNSQPTDNLDILAFHFFAPTGLDTAGPVFSAGNSEKLREAIDAKNVLERRLEEINASPSNLRPRRASIS